MAKKGEVEPGREVWSLSIDATLGQFATTLDGLSEAEARVRLGRDGPNQLAQKKPRPA